MTENGRLVEKPMTLKGYKELNAETINAKLEAQRQKDSAGVARKNGSSGSSSGNDSSKRQKTSVDNER